MTYAEKIRLRMDAGAGAIGILKTMLDHNGFADLPLTKASADEVVAAWDATLDPADEDATP